MKEIYNINKIKGKKILINLILIFLTLSILPALLISNINMIERFTIIIIGTLSLPIAFFILGLTSSFIKSKLNQKVFNKTNVKKLIIDNNFYDYYSNEDKKNEFIYISKIGKIDDFFVIIENENLFFKKLKIEFPLKHKLIEKNKLKTFIKNIKIYNGELNYDNLTVKLNIEKLSENIKTVIYELKQCEFETLKK